MHHSADFAASPFLRTACVLLAGLVRRASPILLAALAVAALPARESGSAAATVLETPGLVAFWDFQQEPGKRTDSGAARFPLREIHGPIARLAPAEGAPFGRYACDVRYQQRFEVPRAEMGALNIRGRDAQVTVVVWMKRRKSTDFGKPALSNEAVAGVWREPDHVRQYCLFLGIQTNAKMAPVIMPQRVSGHVSDTGGSSPGHRWCYEVSLGATVVPWDEWVCVGFTYDGKQIRSYYNGAFDALPDFNPYEHPNGIFDPGERGADFVIGASDVKPNANNQMVAILGGVAVFDRALSEAEMTRLAAPVLALREAAATGVSNRSSR